MDSVNRFASVITIAFLRLQTMSGNKDVSLPNRDVQRLAPNLSIDPVVGHPDARTLRHRCQHDVPCEPPAGACGGEGPGGETLGGAPAPKLGGTYPLFLQLGVTLSELKPLHP